MSLFAGAWGILQERPGSWFVADEIGAQRFAREARDRGVLGPSIPGEPYADAPDVVARVGNVPLVVRRHVPVSTVYVMRPERIPAPTAYDRDLAEAVARSINLM